MRRLIVIGIACVAVAIGLLVALRGDDRAKPTDASAKASAKASATTDPTSATTTATGSSAVPAPEARVDLGEAFTASRFEDVHALCGSRETAAAHALECTVAACKTNRAGDAQRYFVGVADADRPKVEAECEAAHVDVGSDRRRVHPHNVRGKRVIDD